jgi:hypothetical protein
MITPAGGCCRWPRRRAELRALSRDQDRLLESQQRVEAQLRAILDAYHPAPAALFSSVDRDITLAFIANYSTPHAASRKGEQRMAAFCRRQSYRGRVDPAVLTQRLKDHLLTGAAGTVAGKPTPRWCSPSSSVCSTASSTTTTTPSSTPWPSTPTRRSSPASRASAPSPPALARRDR